MTDSHGQAPFEPVRIGVLGTARIATRRVIPALKASAGCDVVAIASRSRARAQAVAGEFGIPGCHDSYEALLASPGIEAVYIPLPNHEHVRWSTRALAAGLHVLCEKPLASCESDLHPLEAAAARADRVVEEAFMVREHPQWAMARALVADGRIGTPRFVDAAYCHTVESEADIRLSSAAGGGALLDVGCYVVATMRLVLGSEPVRVAAHAVTETPDGVDVTTQAHLDFGAALGTFTASIRAARRQRFEVIGTDGWLRVTVPFAHPPSLASAIEIGANDAPGTEVTERIAFEPVDQYVLQAERFARRVRGLPATAWTLSDARANLRVLDALGRASRTTGWCTV